MKKMLEKTSIIAVATLFLTVSIMPMIAADVDTKEDQPHPIEITSVQEDGFLQTETFKLSNMELTSMLGKLSTLMNLLNMAKDKNSILNILLDFIRGDQSPIMKAIINALLNSEMSMDRQLVISAGWGLKLNPFKKSQTDFVRPITFWHYAEQSDALEFPSSTTTLTLNPFQFQTVYGSQFGLMMRFRGVYIEIPQQYPEQSFTFFIGSAKHIMNMEAPTFQLPQGMMS